MPASDRLFTPDSRLRLFQTIVIIQSIKVDQRTLKSYLNSHSKMVFRFRFRPRQLLCLSVCSLLAVLCLLQIVSRQKFDPSLNIIQNAAKAPMSPELLKTVLKSQKPTRKVLKVIKNSSTVKQASRLKPKQRTTLSKDEVVKWYTVESDRMPRIVHLTWKSRQIPSWAGQYVKKWKVVNPGWQVWFWSDEAADKLVRTKFGEYYQMYKGYSSGIQRADAMRYFILYEYGGFYADIDVEPLKPLEKLRLDHPCLLSTEPNAHARFCFKEKDVLALLGDRVACNAIMACRRRHPFFKYVMDMLPMVKTEKNPLGSTGPMMLTYRFLAFQYFVKNVIGKSPHRVLEKQSEVFLAPDVWFMPSYDQMQEGHLKKECQKGGLTKNQKEVCDVIGRSDYVNGPRDESLTNHHWVHTWIRGANKHAKEPSVVEITQVIPDVVFPEEVFDLT